MVDFSRPVQTRDGRPVEIITTKGRGSYPVLYYVGDSPIIRSASADGKYSVALYSDLDLINVPEEREYWICLIPAYPACPFGHIESRMFPGATHHITICGDDCRIEKRRGLK